MSSVVVLYTLAYALLAVCLVTPPTEFVSAGLTVQNLLSSVLGSEQMDFIGYHIRRTTATMIVHAFIPLGYCVGLIVFTTSDDASAYLHSSKSNVAWNLLFIVAMFLPLLAIILARYWSLQKWRNHPIAISLQKLAPPDSNWHSIVSSINVEFRRFDKYATGLPSRRLIVTDSWLMLTSTYFVHVAHQVDVILAIVGSEEHEVYHESAIGVQFLNILVSSVDHKMKSFKIRLNAMEYSDLKEKLRSPIVNARNVVIRQSLTDRFLEAFRHQVALNHVYRKSADLELETCVGCMQSMSNVKLQKLCSDPEEGPCVRCYCRPMWCLECMSKWFASRQDQSQPETWMACRSPCPTCRATFCMLDICKIV